MREIFTYGSVGRAPGNRCLYPELRNSVKPKIYWPIQGFSCIVIAGHTAFAMHPSDMLLSPPMKTTQYFKFMRDRPDRKMIKDEWIQFTVNNPVHEERQSDGRIRRWARIEEAGGKFLRVILLEDGETIHNAFFDRLFRR